MVSLPRLPGMGPSHDFCLRCRKGRITLFSWMLSVAMVTTIWTPFTSAQDSDACNNPENVRDDWRNVNLGHQTPSHCDNNRFNNDTWYQFWLDNQAAEIPTTCLKSNLCGGAIGMRIELEEQTMPEEVNEEINATLCGSYNVLNLYECCVLRVPVTIRKCNGGHFIYKFRDLKNLDRCAVTVCAAHGNYSEFTAAMGENYINPLDNLPSLTTATTTTKKVIAEDDSEDVAEEKDISVTTTVNDDGKSGSETTEGTTTEAGQNIGQGETAYDQTPQAMMAGSNETDKDGDTATTVTESDTTQPTTTLPPKSLPVTTNPPTDTTTSGGNDANNTPPTSETTVQQPDDAATTTAATADTGTGESGGQPATSDIPDVTSQVSAVTSGLTDDTSPHDSVTSSLSTDASPTTGQDTSSPPSSLQPDFTSTPTPTPESSTFSTTSSPSTETATTDQTSSPSDTTSTSQSLPSSPSSVSTSGHLPATISTSTTTTQASTSTTANTTPAPQQPSSEQVSSDTQPPTPPPVPSSSSPLATATETTPVVITVDQPTRGAPDFNIPATDDWVEFDEVRLENIRLVFEGYNETSEFSTRVGQTVKNFLAGVKKDKDEGSSQPWWYSVSLLNEAISDDNLTTTVDLTIQHASREGISNTFARYGLDTYFLKHTGLTLLAYCPRNQQCRRPEAEPSVLAKHAPVLITVLTISAICLCVILFGLLCARYRRRGSYVAKNEGESTALSTSDSHPGQMASSAKESPFTDAQIMKDEHGLESARDGDDTHHVTPEDSWVVPLEEVDFQDGTTTAKSTEDTKL